MKKIFTLFAAALFGLTAVAQSTGVTLVPVATADASKTHVKIMVTNDREDLGGIQLGLFLENGAKWATIFDENLEEDITFIPNPLYYLGVSTKSDTWKNNNARVKADVKDQDNPAGYHVISVILNSSDPATFPATDGELGEFLMDLSACPDGEEVEVGYMSEDPAYSCSASTGGTAFPLERANIIVKKNGNNIEPTGINTVEAIKNVTSVKYYNLQGIESATPFDGVNIMVKTFDDGSKATVKVVK